MVSARVFTSKVQGHQDYAMGKLYRLISVNDWSKLEDIVSRPKHQILSSLLSPVFSSTVPEGIRLLAVCFSLVIGGGYEARRFGKRGMGRDMGAARARRKTDCSLFSCF